MRRKFEEKPTNYRAVFFLSAQQNKCSLDVFGLGEHYRKEFMDSASPIILAAALKIGKAKAIRFSTLEVVCKVLN